MSHLFTEGGGIAGRGVLGGLGVLGGAGYVPPLEQAQGGSFSHPHDSGFIFQDFINPRTQTSLKDVYSLRRQNARHHVWGRWAPPNASAWPPRSWIFTLWSGGPRQDQQVLSQTRCILRTEGDRFQLSHGHDGPIHSLRERSKAHAIQV